MASLRFRSFCLGRGRKWYFLNQWIIKKKNLFWYGKRIEFWTTPPHMFCMKYFWFSWKQLINSWLCTFIQSLAKRLEKDYAFKAGTSFAEIPQVLIFLIRNRHGDLTSMPTGNIKVQSHIPCLIMTVRNLMMTLLHGLISTWRLPPCSARAMFRSASANTFIRTILTKNKNIGKLIMFFFCNQNNS